jgi:hypothetical protein
MATVAELITSIRYPIVDTESNKYTGAEILDYINRGYDLIYNRLIQLKSDLVRTSTTQTLTVGDGSYALPSDFWAIDFMQISGEDKVLKQVNYDYILTYTVRFTPYVYDVPTVYAIQGGQYYLRPEPDQAYTLNVVYYPSLTDLDTSDNAPFGGIFNHALKAYAEAMCKYREEKNISIDQNAASAILRSADITARRRDKRLWRVNAYRWEYEGLVY